MKFDLFKKIALISLILFLIGAIIVLISFSILGFDLKKLSGTTAIEGKYTEVGAPTEITLKINTADLNISFAGDKIEVGYTEIFTFGDRQATKVDITENGSSLEIKEEKLFEPWYSVFNFAEEKIDLTLPEGRQYRLIIEGDTADVSFSGSAANIHSLSITTDTGDINTEETPLNAQGGICLETDTGRIDLGGITANSLDLKSNTGKIKLSEVSVTDTITVVTDTGKVIGTEKIKAKVLNAVLDTGDLNFQDATLDAEKITVRADTGDLELLLVGKNSDYSVIITTDTGDANIRPSVGGSRILDIETDTGDIFVYFDE